MNVDNIAMWPYYSQTGSETMILLVKDQRQKKTLRRGFRVLHDTVWTSTGHTIYPREIIIYYIWIEKGLEIITQNHFRLFFFCHLCLIFTAASLTSFKSGFSSKIWVAKIYVEPKTHLCKIQVICLSRISALLSHHYDQVFANGHPGFTLAIFFSTDNTPNMVSLTNKDSWWFTLPFTPTTVSLHYDTSMNSEKNKLEKLRSL